MELVEWNALAKKHRNDDCHIMSNLGFVIDQAYRYARHYGEVEDYIQDGVEGLLAASKKFDESKGYTFLTFAGFYVTERMRRAQARMWSGVAIKYNMYCGRNRPDKFPEVHLDPDDIFKKLSVEPNFLHEKQLEEVYNALEYIGRDSPKKKASLLACVDTGMATKAAKELNMSASAVRDRVYECRDKLKKRLEYDAEWI